MIAPIMTPRNDRPGLLEQRCDAGEVGRLACQRCFKAENWKRLATAMRTTAASTGCGRALRRCDRNRITSRMKPAAIAPESGVCAPLPSFTSDWDMPPLTGKPRPRPAARFDGQSQELLVGIEASAMLGREGAADRSRLDGGQEDTPRRVAGVREIRPVDGRQARRKSLRDLSQELHAALIESEPCGKR